MYMEADDECDSDSDSEDHVTEAEALACVKHVTFVVKSPPYDVYKLTHVRATRPLKHFIFLMFAIGSSAAFHHAALGERCASRPEHRVCHFVRRASHVQNIPSYKL